MLQGKVSSCSGWSYHIVPFQMCVWLEFTLSRYWLNRLGSFSFLSRNPERQLLRQEKIRWTAIFPPAGRAICLPRAEGTMWTPSLMVSGGGGSSKCHLSSTDLLQEIVSQVDFDDKVGPESRELIWPCPHMKENNYKKILSSDPLSF